VGKLVEEMTTSANLAFASYPGLTYGAIAVVDAHADEALKEVSGPHDQRRMDRHHVPYRGALRHRSGPAAHPRRAARRWFLAISGAKIFISAGEHDLADNIIHLVLAPPDAPPGIRGISLFLVPKVLPDGRRNGVECTGIEHKTGLRGSATCQLAFDEATGWLVGEANKAWPRCSP
jgi:alkylation response protein AidB-like acyl-CoA dehydrogenase